MKLTIKRLAVSVALLAAASVHADDTPQPTVERSPAQVVSIVVYALQRNPSSGDDAGIETVWAFASPGNRAFTGPLERFTAMIKNGFPDMLGFSASRFEDIDVDGNSAVQIVWLRQEDGREVGYAFQLRRQGSGQYRDMWMTEGVVPLGESERSGTSI